MEETQRKEVVKRIWRGMAHYYLPEYMAGGVERYVIHGVMPGDFLTALFQNDLKEAFNRADEDNTRAMRNWVMFMINYMPSESQGSVKKVAEWTGLARQEDATEEAG